MSNSADISFPCPRCGQPLCIDADLAGARVRCPDPDCARECVVPAAAPDEPEPDRPKKKKRRKRSGEEGTAALLKQHRTAYRLLSRALLLHLVTGGLFYLGLLLVGVSVIVTLWQRFSVFAFPEPPAVGEVVVAEKRVLDPAGQVVKFLVAVENKDKKTWGLFTLDESRTKVLRHRVVPAGAPLEAEEDAPVLYLKGSAWAALVLIGLATVLDLGLLVVPDLLARLLLLGGLLTRLAIPLLPLTLFERPSVSLALALLALSFAGCLFCWLTFFRRLGHLTDEPGILTEARELLTLGGVTLGVLGLLLVCAFFPYRLFASAFVWGGLSAAVVKMRLVEGLVMGLIFPSGVPFLIRYLNLASGVRGSLP